MTISKAWLLPNATQMSIIIASWNLTSDWSTLPAWGFTQAPRLLVSSHPFPSSGSQRLPSRDGKIRGGFPFRGSGNQLPPREDVSTQPCQRSSTILGTFSFLEKLWGFLHDTYLPARTEAAWWEGERKSEFPASGQLQITHLWVPETSSLSIFVSAEKQNPGREKKGLEGMMRGQDRLPSLRPAHPSDFNGGITSPRSNYVSVPDTSPALWIRPSPPPENRHDNCAVLPAPSAVSSPRTRTTHLRGHPRTWPRTGRALRKYSLRTRIRIKDLSPSLYTHPSQSRRERTTENLFARVLIGDHGFPTLS